MTSLLQRHEVDDHAAFGLLRDFVDGMSHFHSKGVMHRDVTPNNLCVRFNPYRGVWIDFDFATNNRTSRELLGTKSYVAPEVVAIKRHYPDMRADVWGLGLSLYSIKHGVFFRWKDLGEPDYPPKGDFVDDQRAKKLLARIEEAAKTGSIENRRFLGHLTQALTWEPSKRISAAQLYAATKDVAPGAGKIRQKPPPPLVAAAPPPAKKAKLG